MPKTINLEELKSQTSLTEEQNEAMAQEAFRELALENETAEEKKEREEAEAKEAQAQTEKQEELKAKAKELGLDEAASEEEVIKAELKK